MPALFGSDNAMHFAASRLNGGWKTTLLLCGGYIFVIGALMAISVQFSIAGPATTLANWQKGLLGLQIAILVLLGGLRTLSVLNKEVTSKIIESHRMMPLPPLHAVVGYVTGINTPALALASANVFIGMVPAFGAGVPLWYWPLANLSLICTAIMIWTICAMVGLCSRGETGMPVVIGLVFGIMPAGAATANGAAVAPGLPVIFSPFITPTIFDPKLCTMGITFIGALVVATAFQAAVTAICGACAMRLYRRGDAPMIGPRLGIGLMALLTLATLVGFYRKDLFFVDRDPLDEAGLSWRFLIHAALLVLIALQAIYAAAWARVWQCDFSNGDRLGKLEPPWLTALLATVVIMPMVVLGPLSLQEPVAVGCLALGLVIALLGFAWLLEWIALINLRPGIPGFVWLLLTWGLPVIVDAVYRMTSDLPSSEGARGFTAMALISPIGWVMSLATFRHASPAPTLASHGLALAIMMVINLVPLRVVMTARRRARRKASLLPRENLGGF